MRTTTTAALTTILSLLAAPAAADDGLIDLEVSIPISVAERSTTGTGDELAGYGYDAQTGLLGGLELRLYGGGMNRYMRVGLVAGAQQHAGPMLGLDGNDYAFRSTLVDAGVTVRTVFPCMSSRDVRWHLSGLFAMTGMMAEAGTGVGGEPNGPDEDARTRAADELDHAALGWRLGVDLALHLGNFFVGVGLGLRQLFGVETPLARTWVTDLGLRIGGRIDFSDERAY